MPASLLVLVAAAHAYEVTGITWGWQSHPFEDPILVDVGSWPAAYPDAEVGDAVSEALDLWNDVGIDLALPYGGTTTTSLPVTIDGNWNIVYDTVSGSGWGGTLAYASSWSWSDGVGIDCDITFLSDNDYGDIEWSTDPGGGHGSQVDVLGVALHESGHCLGLDHSGTNDAVMYFEYRGFRELQTDDVNGVESLFAASPCSDDDGDGFTDCEDDCNDSNAAVYPGAPETCDGVDQGCDGVVDADASRTVAMGSSSVAFTTDYISAGNVFEVESATMLLRARERYDVDADTRLVWSLQSSDDGGSSWTLVRSARSMATGSGTEESPELRVPLEAGVTYVLTLGAFVEGMSIYTDYHASMLTQGPVTPIGWVYGRGDGGTLAAADPSYLVDQELDVVDLADADGDGVTEACGDPCPNDPDDDCEDTGVADGTGDDGTPTDDSGTDDSGAGDGGPGDGGGDDGSVTDDTAAGGDDGGSGDAGSDDGPGLADGESTAAGCACASTASPMSALAALGMMGIALARRRR